jgi:hypothetical protein
MESGVYYRAATREVVIVVDGTEAAGDGWQRLSDHTSLGLVAIRRLLVERGVAAPDVARSVYWYLGASASSNGDGGFQSSEPSMTVCEITDEHRERTQSLSAVRS